MKIICLNSEGINKYEKDANSRMEKEFSSKWRGYSALELIDIREGTKEIDFVLVTEDRIVLLELKNWNGLIKFEDNKWYHNGEARPSPVKINANKNRLLLTAFNKKMASPPWIEHRVILCGNAKLENFPDEESSYVIKLEDFLKIKDNNQYKKLFPKPTYTRLPEMAWFDNFFNVKSNVFKPRQFIYQNYRIEGDSTFKHPQDYYKEYHAVREDKNYQALLRRWDLTQFGQDAATQEERADIVLRENKVLGYIKSQNNEYKDYYLQPLSNATKEEVTADFCELYELPHKQLRLNEFINKYQDKLQKQDRIDLIKILLSHFADLHDIEVAHRDISEHCLWLERPAKITISGFISAYFREVKTIVGTLRDVIKAGLTKLPEDTYEDDSDPFRRDVFLLAVAAYLIAYGRYPQQNDDLYSWQPVDDDIFDGKFNSWFEKSMDWTAKNRFKNAREMLDIFNRVKINDSQDIDFKSFEVFRTDDIPMIIYPCSDNIKQGQCHIYRSKNTQNDVIVKIWYGVVPASDKANINFSLFRFLNTLFSLKNNSTIYFIPKIIDFGISPAGTFFVQEYIEGQDFDDYFQDVELSLEEKISLSIKLIDMVLYLHDINIYHGDLHPKNILITNIEDVVKLYLIDMVEYCENNINPCNTAYAPINYETAQPCEIDYYAIAALICDILQVNRNNLSCDIIPKNVLSALKHFFDTPPFLTLQDIKQSLIDSLNPPQCIENYFEVFLKLTEDSESEELLSDNGIYYISAKISDRNKDELIVSITGARKKITIFLKKDDLTLSFIRFNKIEHTEFLNNIKYAQDSIDNSTIKMINSSTSDADNLIEFLQQLNCIKSLINTIDNKEDDSIKSIYVLSEDSQKINTIKIWETILAMEEEMLPEVEVSGSYEIVGNQLYIPYTSNVNTLDFDNNDSVEVSYFDNAFKKKAGILNIKKTDSDSLAIDEYKNLYGIKIGTKLKLINQQTKSSYQRRKSAVERILNQKSVIRNLVNYFDLNQFEEPIDTTDEVTNEELDAYNVYDDIGKIKFCLNLQQREAFRQLYTSSPLSLLQGPPGTGKTAFIASFIHYLVKKGQARHILLVSQSHEAVNNAIEGVNELCERNKLDLDIVRFGAEGMLSDEIRHLHISAIQYKYRETFKASIKARIASLSSNLGLSKEFVDDYFDIEFHLGKLYKSLTDLQGKEEKQKYNQKLETFYRIATEKFDFKNNEEDIDFIIDGIKNNIYKKHKVSSQEAVKKLDNIIAISFEWIQVLATQRGNFEEFLAKTRTLVCGTCVGIGQWHIGVANNQYDWVIIDEAARATASELAIAMQAGKRILLVGDHLQLPPQYNPTDLIKYVSKKLGIDEKLVHKSDFERAFQSHYGQQVGATLTTQYRMASAIGNLVSECFYENKLKTGRDDPKSFYSYLPKPLNEVQVIWMDTSQEASKSYDTPVHNNGYYNTYESDIILHLLKDIADSEEFLMCIKNELNYSEKMIGIICMYAEQKRLINKKLMETDGISSEFKRLVKIDTVDSYQGKENHIIILSLTRNNKDYKQGFLNDAQRINVALSRAKDRLVIVGATKMWEHEKNKDTALGKVLNFIRDQNSTDYLIYDTIHYDRARN
jgi:serine/threonine protein kinase